MIRPVTQKPWHDPNREFSDPLHPYCCWWWWRRVSRGSDKNLRFFFWRRQWQVGEKGSTQFKVQSLKLHNESQKHKTCRDRCITRSSQPLPTSFNRIDESNRSAENVEMIIKFNTAYNITKEELPFTKNIYMVLPVGRCSEEHQPVWNCQHLCNTHGSVVLFSFYSPY